MKPELADAEVDCPACGTALKIPLRLRTTGRTTAEISFDMSAVRAHIDDHKAAGREGGTAVSGRLDLEKRKALIEQLCFGVIFAEDRAGATRMVEEYVHALAERQRKIAEGWAADGYAAEADGLRQGADLIDPPKYLIDPPTGTPR